MINNNCSLDNISLIYFTFCILKKKTYVNQLTKDAKAHSTTILKACHLVQQGTPQYVINSCEIYTVILSLTLKVIQVTLNPAMHMTSMERSGPQSIMAHKSLSITHTHTDQ